MIVIKRKVNPRIVLPKQIMFFFWRKFACFRGDKNFFFVLFCNFWVLDLTTRRRLKKKRIKMKKKKKINQIVLAFNSLLHAVNTKKCFCKNCFPSLTFIWYFFNLSLSFCISFRFIQLWHLKEKCLKYYCIQSLQYQT